VAKNKDVWYEFNDNFVKRLKKTDQKKIISCNAYILFYQKRGIDFENIENYENIRNKLIKKSMRKA
jgi:hypothetical protein